VCEKDYDGSGENAYSAIFTEDATLGFICRHEHLDADEMKHVISGVTAKAQAAVQGLQAGDVIVSVDMVHVHDKSKSELRLMIKHAVSPFVIRLRRPVGSTIAAIHEL
jgi:hypothetical protein